MIHKILRDVKKTLPMFDKILQKPQRHSYVSEDPNRSHKDVTDVLQNNRIQKDIVDNSNILKEVSNTLLMFFKIFTEVTKTLLMFCKILREV